MQINEKKYFTKRAKRTSITAVISISLVLFLLGLAGLLLLRAKTLGDFVKETFEVQIFLADSADNSQIYNVQRYLKNANFCSKVNYVSRQKAAQILEEDLGENFEAFLGYNPLMPSFNITLKSNYAEPDSLILLKQKIGAISGVKEIRYQETVLQLVNKNIQKIAVTLAIACLLLGFIAITLINNAIRLALYSRRFLVKSMQLVGATQGFIRKPFLNKSIFNGLLSGIIAVCMLCAVLYFTNERTLNFSDMHNQVLIYALFAGLVFLGIFVAFISTYFAINKYLRTRTEDLYD